MTFHTRDIQARLAALGHNPGPIDGLMGQRTRAAQQQAMIERAVKTVAGLFHASGLHRIHLHWTAGAAGVIEFERRAYNGLVDHNGNRHWGTSSLEDQARYQAGVRGASHTLNANTGAIGLAIDAMAGANEVPFRAGTAPMTWGQVDEVCQWAAELSIAHDIPVTPYSILTHAEVQPTLGITQRWKWDINWLPDMDRAGDPIVVGNRLRAIISEKRDMILARQTPASPKPAETCETCGAPL